MARPGRPERNRAARSFRQLRRFHHVINADKVFGTHNLVYCENGSSIETVMVNGEVVVQDGRLIKVNEKALLAELRALMPEFKTYTRGVEAANQPFEPPFGDII